VGASVWDIFEVIKDCDPKDLGLAFDIRHADGRGRFVVADDVSAREGAHRRGVFKDFTWTMGS